MKKTVIAVLLAAVTSAANAYVTTAFNVAQVCSGDSEMAQNSCAGYVRGVVDSIDDVLICLPIGTPSSKVVNRVRGVSKILIDKPDFKEIASKQSGADMVFQILSQEYPCKEEPAKPNQHVPPAKGGLI